MINTLTCDQVCKAPELDKRVCIEHARVTFEGWAGPGDPYVVAGSAIVRYELWMVGGAPAPSSNGGSAGNDEFNVVVTYVGIFVFLFCMGLLLHWGMSPTTAMTTTTVHRHVTVHEDVPPPPPHTIIYERAPVTDPSWVIVDRTPRIIKTKPRSEAPMQSSPPAMRTQTISHDNIPPPETRTQTVFAKSSRSE